jgi:double-stranded uracil-DNA glycosylase
MRWPRTPRQSFRVRRGGLHAIPLLAVDPVSWNSRRPKIGFVVSSRLPDILAKDLLVIFCGINPASTAAAAGRHFVSSSNRFWRVLYLAGFTPMQIRPENDRTILHYGYGLTTAAARPTRRASDLSRQELIRTAGALEEKIEHYTPQTVAFLGKAAYAAITKTPQIPWGLQSAPFGGASVWVLPNPSGLNRNFNLADLVKAYSELRNALRSTSLFKLTSFENL